MEKFNLLLDLRNDDSKREEYIDKLEEFINECNKSLAQGVPLVEDSIYDTAKSWLEEVCPESDVLKHTWSEDEEELTDLDVFQQRNPMVSIKTIKDLDCKEVEEFGNAVRQIGGTYVNVTTKMNGHGIRVVYKDGVLVKAHTRGRASNGRNITRQMKIVLGDNPNLAKFGLVEIRGELLLPFTKLDEAKQFNPDIKSAFSGVASMVKDSASDEEISLLSFVAYNVFCDNLNFPTLTHKILFLKQVGFEVPIVTRVALTGNDIVGELQQVVDYMEKRVEGYTYYTDGVVVAIDDVQKFESMGSADSYHLGNLALKVGFWKQDMYSAIVEEIKWLRGKVKLSPVAMITPTLTGTGNTVRNVPLYNPANILLLQAYPGNTIYFRYGGEAGVQPCTSDGRSITDS